MTELTPTTLRALAEAPGDLVAYLHGQGWRPVSRSVDGRELLWRLSDWEVLLPVRGSNPTELRRLGELVAVLERVERRPADAVLADVAGAQVDTVRVRLTPATPSGSAPLDDALYTLDACRDLLLSTAASVDGPRAVFGPRKSDAAMAFVRQLRLRTEPGSFVVALQTPVPVDEDAARTFTAAGRDLFDESLFGDGLFVSPAVPAARQVTLRLLDAVESAVGRAEEVRTGGAPLEGFDELVPGGVSANLLEALARLSAGGRRGGLLASEQEAPDDDFTVAVAWSRTRSAPQRSSASVRVPGVVAPVLRQAAASLRARQPEPDVTVVGTVRTLSRDVDAADGEVVVSATLVEGSALRLRPVRVQLGEAEYRVAVRAHDDRTLVEVRGDLVTRFGLRMEPVRSFRTLSDEGEA